MSNQKKIDPQGLENMTQDGYSLKASMNRESSRLEKALELKLYPK